MAIVQPAGRGLHATRTTRKSCQFMWCSFHRSQLSTAPVRVSAVVKCSLMTLSNQAPVYRRRFLLISGRWRGSLFVAVSYHKCRRLPETTPAAGTSNMHNLYIISIYLGPGWNTGLVVWCSSTLLEDVKLL